MTVFAWIPILLVQLFFTGIRQEQEAPRTGIYFQFKYRNYALPYPMRLGRTTLFQRGGLSAANLDSASNWYSAAQRHIEIIRQDDPITPLFGVALSFEFDESNGEYPYTPEYAHLQFKDFSWGGLEFEKNDTLNYTGVSNTVSEDLQVEVLAFKNDTIRGRFSGLLISGAGSMAQIDSGTFCARVLRK